MNSAYPFIAVLFLPVVSLALLVEDSPLAVQSIFKDHCIKCHGKKGKVNLLKMKSNDDLLAKPKLLQTLLEALKKAQDNLERRQCTIDKVTANQTSDRGF